jgi:hypothetical protein
MLFSFLQGQRGCGEVGVRGGGGGGGGGGGDAFKREPSLADLKKELSQDARTRDGGGGGGGRDGIDPHPGCGKKRMYYFATHLKDTYTSSIRP